MANYGSGSLFILLGGYSLTGYMTTLDDSVEKFTEDDTRFGQSFYDEAQTGLAQAAFALSGFYDDAALGPDVVLAALAGTDRVLTYGFEGDALGKRCRIVAGALQNKYVRTPAIGKLHRISAGFAIDGQVDEGLIVAPASSRGAASNTEATSLDNAAASTNGGIASLHVTALSLGGYTNLAPILEHSTDNATFTTKGTFTVVTAAPASQALVLSGTINRYTAYAWSYGGAGAGPTHTAQLALARR